jgi:hypothetical protein
VQRGIKLYSCTWAATEAHRLYLNLQEKIMPKPNVSIHHFFCLISIITHSIKHAYKSLGEQSANSKITIIHDIWTTKGNHHAFMGIAEAYITDDWVFWLCHLGMKYISWTHKGKYLAVPFANILTKSSLHKKISHFFSSSINSNVGLKS